MSSIANVDTSIIVDALGEYIVALKATDSKGASAEKRVSIMVDNSPPITSTSVAVQYTPISVDKPAQSITVGSAIVLDASASTDPDGQFLSHTFELLQRPTGSTATLATSAAATRLIAEQLGAYKLRVRSTNVRGIYADTNFTFNAENRAPVAFVVSDVKLTSSATTSNTITTSVGYDIVLNGATSSDPDGDALNYVWTFSKPFNSAINLSSTIAATTQFAPDVMGTYSATLTVTDTKGAKSVHTVNVNVNNRRPTATVTSNATPQALVGTVPLRMPPGTELTLRGGGSIDADDDVLTYLWEITSKPAASAATLSATTEPNTVIRIDVAGNYAVRLKVTDTKGASSQQTVFIESGFNAPHAILDKSNIMALVGEAINASAALSFDSDGDALTFAWAIDARPAGSTASIADNKQSTLVFTSDVPGAYILSVTVSDGRNSSIALLTLGVRANALGVITLAFEPINSKYSRAKDLLVMISASPNAVRILDPIAGAVRNIPLELAPKVLSISPNGLKAAVVHSGAISYIDLSTNLLLRTVRVAADPTEIFLTNSGVAYVFGQSGGQWVTPAVNIVDLTVGVELTFTQQASPWVYGGARGVFADKLNRGFFVNPGLSPSDVSYFTIDPVNYNIINAGDSPYHGNYNISAPLWLSEDQGLVFTASGTYFRTSSLNYAGTLAGGNIQSISHNSAAEELLALTGGAYDYYTGQVTGSNIYRRYSGSFFSFDREFSIPDVGGLASTGVGIFHSGTGKHVMLAKTGGATTGGPGIAYHVIYR